MGRRNKPKSRPQSVKELRERMASLTPRADCHTGADKLPRTGSKVYGSGSRKGVTGGRGGVRPPGTAHVSPLVDASRGKPSLTSVDPTHPGTTTVLRSRKGGTSAAYVKPPKPRDECIDCGSTGQHASDCAYHVAPEERAAREAYAQTVAREHWVNVPDPRDDGPPATDHRTPESPRFPL